MPTLPQAPGWLPYRARSAWDNWRIDRAAYGANAIPPTPAAPPGGAAAEVHMLVCRRDLRIAALALKSLLRFAGLPLAVTLTDDGSLSEADRDWLSGHVPGSRWLPRRVDEPAVRDVLADRPRLAALYGGSYHPICKLLHPLALARCPRVIVLDPDTAFFRRPDLLADWAAGDGEQPYYLHDHGDEAGRVPETVRAAFRDLAATITPPGRTWRLDRTLFNSGLLLYRPDRLDPDAAEGYLRWRESAPADLRSGPARIWFGDWTPEQTGYLAMFAVAEPPAVPLGDDYRLGGGEGFAFNHFLRHYLVRQDTLRRLRGLAQKLGAGHPRTDRTAAASSVA